MFLVQVLLRSLIFIPRHLILFVNGLWFTSLSLSLTTALFAVITKQWIHRYMSVPSGTPRDRCRVRQFRYMGLQQWRVGFIIGLLPVLMSASLCIFLVGLVVFLVPLQVSIASVVGSITSISFAAYFITNLLPIIYPSCPYKTPLSQYIFLLYTCITHNGFLTSNYRPQFPDPVPNPCQSRENLPFVHFERLSVQQWSTVRTRWKRMHCPGYFACPPTPAYRALFVEAISALPVKVCGVLWSIAKKGFWRSAVHSPFDALRHSEGRKFDRLIRTFLRLSAAESFFLPLLPPQAERERLSPDVYAEMSIPATLVVGYG